MINLLLTGMEPLLDHQAQTLTIESICWQSLALRITPRHHQFFNSTQRSTCHVLTKQMELSKRPNSTCSQTGTLDTPSRRFWSVSRMRCQSTRNSLNHLMEICSEDLISLKNDDTIVDLHSCTSVLPWSQIWKIASELSCGSDSW